ncbi:GNAT family N-acetyltransferase [Corynebacterium terpenotabidum]|uniref:Putative acetyltransferase n=1 Tax=Corynebacterium terpenotabidum Y-11 TaxID=1200352 RepID=S4XFV9_9CORY|nr:N-acetyltransferase [Corynebacterium terpenotabidum]AGP30530.1 putative acetyltransferase [Corynebacterium terpenotabidum Y-11]
MDTTTVPTPAPSDFNYPVIRPERFDGADIGAIRALTAEAFSHAEHAAGNESQIIDALRNAGALSYSLVAVHAGRLVGHAAASRVTLDPDDGGTWYGIGPVSVHPDFRRQGTGSALMRALLDLLVVYGATGVVLLGDPSLYARFGFAPRPGLVMAGLPAEQASNFQALRLDGVAEYPAATVTYHPAFDVG